MDLASMAAIAYSMPLHESTNTFATLEMLYRLVQLLTGEYCLFNVYE